MPEIGEAVPDFSFVDQNGRRVHLHQFRGKPLLLTFIYTRCPLPDFCIRMSNNFGQLAQRFEAGRARLFMAACSYSASASIRNMTSLPS